MGTHAYVWVDITSNSDGKQRSLLHDVKGVSSYKNTLPYGSSAVVNSMNGDVKVDRARFAHRKTLIGC